MTGISDRLQEIMDGYDNLYTGKINEDNRFLVFLIAQLMEKVEDLEDRLTNGGVGGGNH